VPLGKWAAAVLLVTFSCVRAQEQRPPEPPEEDEAYAEKQYSFNPIQAEKELKVGNFYFKKRSYQAAAARFREATRWNENYAEAYLRLGETLEKWKGLKAAVEAYAKYLKLEPEGKDAKEVRRRLSGKL